MLKTTPAHVCMHVYTGSIAEVLNYDKVTGCAWALAWAWACII